jgi:hypothetical protein
MLNCVGDALCEVGVLTPEQKVKPEDLVFARTKLV